VELTFFLAVLNISLGFVLAMYLGYGPMGLADAWGVARRYRPHVRVPLRVPFRMPFPLPRLFPKRDAAVEEILPDLPLELPEPEGLEELFDAGGAAVLGIEPCDEPYDDDAAALLDPSPPELWDLNEKYVETSVLRLNIAMIKSGVRASEIDCRLRACKGRSDHETLETCLRLLREDCVSYLAEQSAAAQKFRDRIGEMGELSSLGEEIEMGNLEQAAQVETTLNNLEYMDFSGNTEEGNHRLLEEIKNLGIARHRLRDKQEAAFLAIARCENRIEKIEKQLFGDPLSQLLNRIGLEASLHSWWKQGRQKTKSLTAAMFDLDRLGSINEHQGPLLGDRILHQIGQILQSTVGEGDVLARYSGNRFVAVLLDVGPRAALKIIERARQTIEKTTFVHDAERIKVTVGCAIAEVTPDEGYMDVLSCLERTMKIVKDAGPNRSYFHDGRSAEPVKSPSFGAEANEIVI
jgi:diguanylate cyclase (GGDEF)-like protein